MSKPKKNSIVVYVDPENETTFIAHDKHTNNYAWGTTAEKARGYVEVRNQHGPHLPLGELGGFLVDMTRLI